MRKTYYKVNYLWWDILDKKWTRQYYLCVDIKHVESSLEHLRTKVPMLAIYKNVEICEL